MNKRSGILVLFTLAFLVSLLPVMSMHTVKATSDLACTIQSMHKIVAGDPQFLTYDTQTTFFFANVSGGVAPYHYDWYYYYGGNQHFGTDSPYANKSLDMVTGIQINFYCQVTDSDSGDITPSCGVYVFCGGGITALTISVANNTDLPTDINGRLDMTATPSGGTTGQDKGYQWFIGATEYTLNNTLGELDWTIPLPAFGIPGENTTSLNVTFSSLGLPIGNYTVSCVVWNGVNYIPAMSAQVALTMYSPDIYQFPIIAVIGLIGLVGIIITPTWLVHSLKKKFNTNDFILAISAMSVCVGMFLSWVGSCI